MIYLRTGLPGASKSLNSLRELVLGHDANRQYFYNNIKLLMLDFEVCYSFSGWYYGWYFPRLKDKSQKAKLTKIMKPIHDDGEFVSMDDVPWLKPQFESHNHLDTWLYWVRRVYPREKLAKLENMIEMFSDEELASKNVIETIKSLNLHFTHFEDPATWYQLPKKSVVLIDECQQFFPPRPAGSRVPDAIRELETHRHGGYDLHFITQDATLADQNLRKLVGRHIHFHNPFGGKRITRYESAKLFKPDDYHDRKQATSKFTAHATNFYGLYWSAEIHTHKFKLPKSLILLVFMLVAIVSGLSYVYFGVIHKENTSQEMISDSPTVQAPLVQPTELDAEQRKQKRLDNLSRYLDDTLDDVFITGSIKTKDKSGNIHIDYVFYRASDESVFDPTALGFTLQSESDCLAIFMLATVRRPVTCNPFYVRKPMPDDDDSRSEFLGSKNNSVSF